MPKPYSEDLRERVIEAVESGASRRETAENYRLSPSSAVRWWRRWHDTGSVKAKPSGGSKSPLEEHAEWLLALVAEQPDLTLDEIVTAMRKRRIPGSRTAVWRFFERHNLTFKRSPTRRRLGEDLAGRAGRGDRALGPSNASQPSRSRPLCNASRDCFCASHCRYDQVSVRAADPVTRRASVRASQVTRFQLRGADLWSIPVIPSREPRWEAVRPIQGSLVRCRTTWRWSHIRSTKVLTCA